MLISPQRRSPPPSQHGPRPIQHRREEEGVLNTGTFNIHSQTGYTPTGEANSETRRIKGNLVKSGASVSYNYFLRERNPPWGKVCTTMGEILWRWYMKAGIGFGVQYFESIFICLCDLNCAILNYPQPCRVWTNSSLWILNPPSSYILDGLSWLIDLILRTWKRWDWRVRVKYLLCRSYLTKKGQLH